MGDTYFVKQHKKDKFTILDNTCIQDPRLSWKAKGLHTYFMSLKEDWKVHLCEIAKHSTDGIDSLYTAVKALEEFKYLKKIRTRRPDGCFGSTVYYIYERPYDGSSVPVVEGDNPVQPQPENPDVEKPHVDYPRVENPTLITTNITNTKLTNTKLTNYNSQSVSESVFEDLIKELFSGDFPFDKNFECDVLKRLEAGNVEQGNAGSYLKYVFERTKAANPSKSFEGLFRKLALSSSITRDFKLSNLYEKSENQEQEKPKRNIKYVTCSICGSQFDELDYYCPKCGTSLKAINGEDKTEYAVHKKLFEMNDEEKKEYDAAYSQWEEQTKRRTGRMFVLADEKILFWKSRGILPDETETNN